MGLHFSVFSKLIFLMKFKVNAIGFFTSFCHPSVVWCVTFFKSLSLEPSQSPIPSQNHHAVFYFLSFSFLGLICNLNCSFQLVLIDCLSSVSRIESVRKSLNCFYRILNSAWHKGYTEQIFVEKLMTVPKHFVSQNIWLSIPSVYQLGMPRSVPLYEGVPCVCSSGVPTPFVLRGSPILCTWWARELFLQFFLGPFALTTWKSSATVCLTLIPWRLWPSTPWVSATFFMSSRGIVSAKSEIPGNRHHPVIGMPSSSRSSAPGNLRKPSALGGITGLQKWWLRKGH